MTAPRAAPESSLLAVQAAAVRQKGRQLVAEKLDGIRARALTESTLREVAVRRLAKARSDMAALRARLNRST